MMLNADRSDRRWQLAKKEAQFTQLLPKSMQFVPQLFACEAVQIRFSGPEVILRQHA